MQTKRNKVYPYFLLAPALAVLFAVNLYPALYSIYLAMHRTKRGIMEFVFLKNFELIFKDSNFFESLKLTLIFLIAYVFFTTFLAYLFALALNKPRRLNVFYITAIFVPWVLSDITSGIVWRWMFYHRYGIIQNLIEPLIGGKTLIGTPWGALAIVVVASIWRSVSFSMVLLLAGLQTIPREIHEAASIDGANNWNKFWRITWPLTLPTTLVVIIFLSIQAVNNVGLILVITSGGPGRATELLSLMMYREAIVFFNFGYGSAIAVILLTINIILALIYFQTLRRGGTLSDIRTMEAQ